MTLASVNPIGASTTLFDASRYAIDPNARSFDVSNDGRFLFVKPPASLNFNVILNWWSEVSPMPGAAGSPP
ncbi:hypothetical protein [Gemmatimonas sp.]|uniref:hypothetical protein n=1 Tax=Gemmatimonas sp. TaxID=1962908 RepID=UPI00356B077C